MNPNGIPSLSPGLRRRSYPGLCVRKLFPNPERVASSGARFDATPLGLMKHLIRFPRVARASQPLYVSFCLPCLASAKREDRTAAAPAGAAAAWTRSFNPRTFESVAQLDPSALLRPELEPLPERRLNHASSYPQE